MPKKNLIISTVDSTAGQEKFSVKEVPSGVIHYRSDSIEGALLEMQRMMNEEGYENLADNRELADNLSMTPKRKITVNDLDEIEADIKKHDNGILWSRD